MIKRVNLGKLPINELGVVVYPDDIDTISNTTIINGDTIADYSGDLDFPLYIPPAHKVHRFVSTLKLYTMMPPRLEAALVYPEMVLPDMDKYITLKVFANRINASQVAGANGLTFGVDLEDEMTKEGFSEALRLGMVTQEEVDAVFK